MKKKKINAEFLEGNMSEREPLEYPGLDGRMVSKRTTKYTMSPTSQQLLSFKKSAEAFTSALLGLYV
jgi:hypothetical protein